MTLALLESIIFNRITGPQSSPLTPATTLKSLGIKKAELTFAMRTEGHLPQRASQAWQDSFGWLTLQDVLNFFPEPEPVTTERETGNP